MVAAFDYQKHHAATVGAARKDAYKESTECPYCPADKPQLVYRGNWERHMAAHHAEKNDFLTYDEARTLQAHESVIQAGVSMFRAAGKALQEINAKRLYRTQYETFADYCYERWQISRAYAYRLISASEVVDNLAVSPIGDTEVLINEAQARELAVLEPDEQRAVWTVIKKTAPKGKVTAQHTKSVVNVCKSLIVTGAIDDGTGEQIAVSEVAKAAVIEETYERMKRQEIHIDESNARKEAKLAASYTSPAETTIDEPTAPAFILETQQVNGLHYAVIRYGGFATNEAALDGGEHIMRLYATWLSEQEAKAKEARKAQRKAEKEAKAS